MGSDAAGVGHFQRYPISVGRSEFEKFSPSTTSTGFEKTCFFILAYLKHYWDRSGPHLVVVSMSTLQNWHREFKQWTPDFNIVTLAGTKEDRAEIITSRLIPQDFEVCITSYEMCLIETAALKKI
jgi:SNF2 family DNA or RNA helicase